METTALAAGAAEGVGRSVAGQLAAAGSEAVLTGCDEERLDPYYGNRHFQGWAD